jgi:uncharacterized protein YdeI (BOF family)
MKKVILSLILMIAVSGCGKTGDESYGQPIANRQTTELKEIVSDADAFKDKQVTLEGKIVRQCPTGCWFDIQQGTAVVHVDINPSGFAIPQKPNKTVLVEGTVTMEDGQIEVIGTGVEIK